MTNYPSIFARLLFGLGAVALAFPATYSYDAANRLTRIAYPDGTTISYAYDSAGNRLSQTISNPSISLPKVGVDKSALTFSAASGQTPATQVVVVTNGGGGSLQWDAVATANWLSVTPESGTNSGAVTVTASAAGMSAGTYNASVMILASASNAPVTVPVIFTVTEAQGNPTISSGGIVSAAGSTPGIARGSVASLYGAALADAPASATTVPLPRSLGNVQVSVNGVNAPLWYVNPGQINFQVPFEAPLQGQASVVVTRDGVPSAPVNVALMPYAPSVFTYERTSDVFDPIIVHATTNQLVTPTSPAVPGEYLIVYGTGIGDLTVLPATGETSPANPPATAKLTPTATIGVVNAPVTFAGLTPDSIGLAQFNIQVPTSVPSGSTAPLVVSFNTASSQPVNLAIASGAGPPTPSASVRYTFTPSSVTESPDGKWYYSVALQETAGVGVTITKIVVGDLDYTSSITSWFGSNRLPAGGQLQGTVSTACGCSPPGDGRWELSGSDDNGHTGLAWSATVHFLLQTAPAIATVASGIAPNARGLAVDSSGNIYDVENNTVKRVAPSGNVTVVAGNGTAGFSGDGGAATSAQLNLPLGVAVDSTGNLYIADYLNGRIRRVDPNGIISTFAGNGINTDAGDGGPATSASFAQMENVATDQDGNVYVITALTVRKIGRNGIVRTVAGRSTCAGGGFSGDGGPAPDACLYVPDSLAFKTNGNIYIADSLNRRIRQVDAGGIIATFAGTGSAGFSGDGGPASQAAIDSPAGIVADQAGNIFFSSCLNQRIRMISTVGVISTVAGTGEAGSSGDNGPPAEAQLSCPTNLALGPDGAIYVLDSGNLHIRRIFLLPLP
jgi:uncharacterized protein (TIGR03437 family)